MPTRAGAAWAQQPLRVGVLGIASLLMGCTDERSDTHTSFYQPPSVDEPTDEAPPAPRFRWVEVNQAEPDLDAIVANHAALARRELALTPIVHVRTPWNTGPTLRRFKDDPEVQQALDGTYLIEIVVAGVGDICDSGSCRNTWATLDQLCFSYAQTLHAIDDRGQPAAPSGSPGKFGPETAEENAAMLRDFREALSNEPKERCLSLAGGHR